MKWVADHSSPDHYHLEIKSDVYESVIPVGAPEVIRYNLYVWKNGEGFMDGQQNTLEAAMRSALRQFGVPLTAWQQVDEPSSSSVTGD